METDYVINDATGTPRVDRRTGKLDRRASKAETAEHYEAQAHGTVDIIHLRIILESAKHIYSQMNYDDCELAVVAAHRAGVADYLIEALGRVLS